MGDWNGDGHSDLRRSRFWSINRVSILVSDGQRGFHAIRRIVLGTNSGVAVGDFNMDGHADVVGSAGGPRLSVAVGDGHGHFQQGAIVAIAGAHIVGVAVADLDGSGADDIVAADPVGGKLWVLLANGDGTFQTPVPYAAGAHATWPAIADFDGDHNLDVAVAPSAAAGSTPQPMTLLLGNGDGSFGGAMTPATMTPEAFVTVGDLNADNKLDLVNGAYFALGNGDGSFQSAGTVFGFNDPPQMSASVGDFNEDGHADVLNCFGTPGSVIVSLGDGHGNFAFANDGPRPTASGQCLADFNCYGHRRRRHRRRSLRAARRRRHRHAVRHQPLDRIPSRSRSSPPTSTKTASPTSPLRATSTSTRGPELQPFGLSAIRSRRGGRRIRRRSAAARA